MSENNESTTCRLCNSTKHYHLTDIRSRPLGEKDIGIDPATYLRTIVQCQHCRVYLNIHDNIDETFYRGTYNETIYGSNIEQRYESVMGLPHAQSDNRQRVERIVEFFRQANQTIRNRYVLDIGSGLCVFLGALKETGAFCECLDPDLNAVQHALTYVHIDKGYVGSLESVSLTPKYFLITLNKVLEHVPDPIRYLTIAADALTPDGIIYLELPDGTKAKQHGFAKRQEFFMEHLCIFNIESCEYLIQQANLKCLELQTICEPSGKYTIYAFCQKSDTKHKE